MKKVSIYLSVLLLFLFVGQSSVYAGWYKAKAAYERGHYEAAFKELKPLAEQGDAVAQNNLGFMYAKGEGVPKDVAEAIRWFKKAAEQGDEVAQHNLGLIYVEGEGVPKDYTEAIKWFKKAAKQGDAVAQEQLGAIYVLDRGIPSDYLMAYMWLNLAASQGKETASELINRLEEVMLPEQIAEAQRLSREFKVTKTKP